VSAETKPILDPKLIDQVRQNKVTRIVRDLAWRMNDETDVYAVLLARGVFKWFSVRRRLIKLKERWKTLLEKKDSEWRTATGYGRAYLKGYRAALRDCRAEVRTLCHSPRWQCQDNDYVAREWLWNFEDEVKERILHQEEESQEVASGVVPGDEGRPSKITENPVGNLGGTCEIPVGDELLKAFR
jgi:hypothetical protein